MKRPPKSEKSAKVWAVASGKGGVGKTFISSSLAISLNKLGHTVTLVDLDLSGANIHTTLGIPPSLTSIRQFFEGGNSLQELVLPTPFPRLSYVQGFWDAWAPTELTVEQVRSLAPSLRSLPSDYVIVDLGAGAQCAHFEMLKQADEKILISTPEPTCIEKNYRFIESFVCHGLKENSTPESYRKLVHSLREHRQNLGPKYFSFREYVHECPGINPDHFEALTKKPLHLIVNFCRSQANYDLGYAIKSVCHKYYDLQVDFLGSLDYDNSVWQSIRNREPVLISQPFTPLAGQFLTTCKSLVDAKDLQAAV